MAAPNECIPLFSPDYTRTIKAAAAITGCQFVKVTAARTGGGLNAIGTDLLNLPVVSQCSVSGEAAVGVAANDIAINGVGKIYSFGHGVILPITSGAAITAGVEVQTDAAGKAITLAGGKALGYAVDSCSSGALCEILFY